MSRFSSGRVLSRRYREVLPRMLRLEDRVLLSVVNEFPLSSTSDPTVITAGPDGRLWYTSFTNEPGAFNTTTHTDTTANTGLFGENAITTGPDGNLWIAYTDGDGGEVSKMNTSGNILATYNLGESLTPRAITTGPDGALWTAGDDIVNQTAADGSTISGFTPEFSRITTGGAVTTYPTGLFNDIGASITTGADGALWLGAQASGTEYVNASNNLVKLIGTSEVARLLPGHAVSDYDVGANNALITGITAGPGGAVYYSQANNIDPDAVSTQELIGRITVNADTTINLTKYIITADTSQGSVLPGGIINGLDGKLWFSEGGAQAVASLDPTSGTIATYDVPSGAPGFLTNGPDGNIWFTEQGAGTLGEIDLSQLGSTVTITANGTSISALAELPFSGPAATFTSNLAGATASSFTATINWGDGNTSTGTIALASDGVTFVVSGTNTYETAGTFHPVVTITSATATATANSTAVVASSLIAAGGSVTHLEKSSFTTAVASFVGPVAASGYTATIHWGDGSTSAGTIVAVSGGFQVVGTHTYATQGNYTAQVTIADAHQSVTVNTAATITDIPLLVTGDTLNALPLLHIALGVVATFTDDPGLSASIFTTSINWGDGSTSGGLVIANPLQSGQYFVLGVHQYKKRGTFTTAITVTNTVEGSVVTADGHVVVS